MALQQPVHAVPYPTPLAVEAGNKSSDASPLRQPAPTDTQAWLLFPAAKQPSLSQVGTASTTCTSQTAALSRLSEFGSFDTLHCPAPDDSENGYALEDDEDLDSLDEGLHAFQEHLQAQEPTHADHACAILPAHDGLGTFPGSSALVQAHLWQFERANPQRKPLGHNRRRSSVQRRLDALEHDDGLCMERQRMDRIERWRLEHSRILLEEVEKASRRRSSHAMELPTAATVQVAKEAGIADHGTISAASRAATLSSATENTASVDNGGNPWYRIVRILIRDLLGIDEGVLSLIFGEALPCEDLYIKDILPATDRGERNRSLTLQSSPTSSLKLLDRLSQDLASVLRKYSYTPVAVGSPVNRVTLDYAGIPIADARQPSTPSVIPFDSSEAESDSPLFKPTLEGRPRSAGSEFCHAALWGIEEEPAVDKLSASQDQEYWEQTPSIRTIFRLLQQHFTARRRPLLAAGNASASKPSNVATTSTVDSLRRASVIRQYHPLVSRQHARRSATINRHYSSHSIPNMSSPLCKRAEGSCASISSKRSKRGSGSSRNYWDIGGSIGSGSLGGNGAWGEV
ncbi:MAG: hypothetical protein LQ348_003987 [Seirophora lacunosa]|nr:MAG: hypothetical protein LQ344_005031 [Seirophora lacunosa]KAI4188030.1 MAG: hypothetical protein LQ348_003987 [Seirophora lacunosa]